MADAITLARFRAGDLTVSAKADGTPVSDADHSAERAVRERIEQARPADAILGEEFGHHGAGRPTRRWILDPIDGTKNYVRGIPVWANLIALEDSGTPMVGVVSAPALGRRWWALRGEGAFADGQAIHVSAVSHLSEAHLSYDNFVGFEKHGLAAAALALERRCGRARGFGDFWSHVLVAEGAVDIALEPEVAHWDVAAIQVIVEAAGGRFTDVQGRPRADGGSALSTNGTLHPDVLRILAAGGAGAG